MKYFYILLLTLVCSHANAGWVDQTYEDCGAINVHQAYFDGDWSYFWDLDLRDYESGSLFLVYRYVSDEGIVIDSDLLLYKMHDKEFLDDIVEEGYLYIYLWVKDIPHCKE